MGFVLDRVVNGNEHFDHMEHQVMKRIVLTSGGLDSATLLFISQKEMGTDDVVALFFDYGQKASQEERRAVKDLVGASKLIEKDIADLFQESNSSLIRKDLSVTEKRTTGNRIEYESIKTEVEFRNGLLLAIAISLAMQLYPTEEVEIAYGAIRTREPYPDCSYDFVRYYNDLANLCSNGRVRIVAPFLAMGKDNIRDLAREYGVPTERTWSCYEGGNNPCGICPACLDRKIVEV